MGMRRKRKREKQPKRVDQATTLASPDQSIPTSSRLVPDPQLQLRPVEFSGPPAVTLQEAWYENAKLRAFLDLVQKLVFIFGIPVGIYTFFDTHDKERRDRERSTYEKLDDRYWDYMKLSMNNPQLHVTDATNDPVMRKFAKDRSQLTPNERIKERQIMYLLIAMHERAYVMYHDQSSVFKKQQWDGWQNALQRWLDQDGFLEAWRQIGEDFDADYAKHVNTQIAKLSGATKKKAIQ